MPLQHPQEVRDAHPDTEVTIIHSKPSLLSPIPSAGPESSSNLTWSSPPTNPKLSKSLEQVLKNLNVNLILDDSVYIPVGDNASVAGEWDGSFGLQDEVKKLKLRSGKEVQGDYIFVSVGNNPNIGLVASVDPTAITSGLIAVDDYLKVNIFMCFPNLMWTDEVSIGCIRQPSLSSHEE